MMRIRPDCIGFDFDGVIADIGEAFIRLACTNHGYCSINLEEIRSFQVENSINIPQKIVENIFEAILADSLLAGLKPLHGAIETLDRLCEYADLTVITARPQIQPVIDWFDYYFSAQTNKKIRLVATGDHDNKESYIRDCGLSHFVDDRAKTCMQLAKSGLKPIVFSQPWNLNQHNLPAVSDWKELSSLFDFFDHHHSSISCLPSETNS